MRSSLLLILVACLVQLSCAPIHPPVEPGEEAGEVREDFSKLLASRAPRDEVEMIAALGSSYRLRPEDEINTVREELAGRGKFDGHSFGNDVFRIKRIERAEALLVEVWPKEDFSATSALGRLFQRYPSASVALMEGDDQRILFFDTEDRLAVAYPR